MTDYSKHFNVRKTPQSKPIPGQEARMVKNSAGGYVYPVGKWEKLARFLVLGNEGGTYYASEQRLTIENAQCVAECLKEDGPRTVSTIVEISEAGRAPKNDPALFALAMAISPTFANTMTRALASKAVSMVARQAPFLFRFASFVNAMRGWGRLLRDGISGWYETRNARELAYQMVKYQQRHGWSHRDVLRLSHPEAKSEEEIKLYRYARLDEVPDTDVSGTGEAIEFILGFEELKRVTNPAQAAKLISKYRLPWEAVPTQLLREAYVWEALLEDMPLTAMIRNLGKMTNVGLVSPFSRAQKVICERLRDEKRLVRSRIHPLSVLVALKTYESGHGVRGSLSWTPSSHIIDALNDAFYLSFGAIVPTRKRILLALDISGSMNTNTIAGMIGITPRIAAAAMAMVLVRSEPNYHITGFSHKLISLSISPQQRLDEVIRATSRLPFGATDCSLPMIYAMRGHPGLLEVDAFITITDNESWYGDIHPSQALASYRKASGIPARFIAVGMTATNYSIADPDDALSLNVVGFDTAAPQFINDFIKGDMEND